MRDSIDNEGNVPLEERGIVLLSGGMDSALALHWALWRYRDVVAIGFDYGQPHRDAEVVAAGAIARDNGVPYSLLAIADAMRPTGLLACVEDHIQGDGKNAAFVPGRNIIFLSLALSHGAARWPIGDFDIVIGACAEDASGFPDCRLEFMRAAGKALSLGVDRNVGVAAPFIKMDKVTALKWAGGRFPKSIDDAARSWSCYRGKGPCGSCTACVMRTRAFAAHGIADNCQSPRMFGGDPERSRRQGG